MNTIELIQTIERRPGMYIDIDSITSLYSFVQGFYFARSQSGLLDERDTLFSEKFYPWLKDKYSLEGAPSWSALIERLASTKGLKPLDVFFIEFKEFLQQEQEATEERVRSYHLSVSHDLTDESR